jgi:two-component system, OmpR family, response regulator QseB
MRLLLVEDDPMIGRAARHGLVQAGFAVDWVTDGLMAHAAIETKLYDGVILDIGLPLRDGMTLLKQLRSARNRIPVLITSARDTVRDRVDGLNAGADDYLLKPFDLDELIARVRALMRRPNVTVPVVMTLGELTMDPLRRVVTKNGEEVTLTAKEFAILEVLLLRPGAVVSRERLEESVYGWGEEIGSNALEVHLHNLRRKLGTGVIRNVRGVGYTVAG